VPARPAAGARSPTPIRVFYGRQRSWQMTAVAHAHDQPSHGESHSVLLTLPPLATVMLRAGGLSMVSWPDRLVCLARPYPLGATWDGTRHQLRRSFPLTPTKFRALACSTRRDWPRDPALRDAGIHRTRVWHGYLPNARRRPYLRVIAPMVPLRAAATAIASTITSCCSIPTRRRLAGELRFVRRAGSAIA